MKILLTNDDGIEAKGLITLARALEEAGHELVVVAPASQHSAQSHAITLRRALQVKRCHLEGISGRAYSVDGTPADCTRVGLEELLPDADLVFSGINQGYNAGMDILYSGTVSAAIEANVFRVSAVAVSAEFQQGDEDYDTAAVAAMDIFSRLSSFVTSQPMVLNINVPKAPYKGVEIAPLGGVVIDDYDVVHRGEDLSFRLVGRKRMTDEEKTDRVYLEQGIATVTPLIYDLRNAPLLEACQEAMKGGNS